MNNIFDIKRFGNYLVYELKHAFSNYAVSGAILALMPAILFALVEAISILLSGMDGVVVMPFGAVNITAAVIVLMVMMLSMPAKLFGQITDKRYGSSWLMLPASSFEKSLGIMLVAAIIAPAVIISLFVCVDSLMSLCFGSYYGKSLVGMLSSFDGIGTYGQWDVEFHYYGLALLSLIQSMLMFTLGAIYFKKSKSAKTILAAFVISMAVSMVFGPVFMHSLNGLDNVDMLMDRFSNPDSIVAGLRRINIIYIADNLITYALLCGGIYYRVKTLKH